MHLHRVLFLFGAEQLNLEGNKALLQVREVAFYHAGKFHNHQRGDHEFQKGGKINRQVTFG